VLISAISFGICFVVDIFFAIAPSLIEQLDVSRGTVGAFYTMYAIAAIFSVFIAGIVTDRLGCVKAGLIFLGIALAGSGIIAVSKNLVPLFIGRFIFGTGAESMLVVNMAIISLWFKTRMTAVAMAIYISAGRVGTLFSFNTGELIVAHFGGFRYALVAAFIICCFAFLCFLFYIAVNRQGGRKFNIETESQGNRIALRDIKSFPFQFWCISFICVCFYSAIFPFTALSTDLFVDKWEIIRFSQFAGGFFQKTLNNILHIFTTAGGITSIITVCSIVLTPLFGLIVDKIGKRVTFMLLGSMLLIPGHLLLGYSGIYPAFPMLILGLAFVLLPAALWPSIVLVTKKGRIGTAMGTVFAIQNIGIGLFAFLNGLLRDMTDSYKASLTMFAVLGMFSLICVLLLKRFELRTGNTLEMP